MFTNEALKEQRKDLLEDITKVEFLGVENDVLHTAIASDFEVTESEDSIVMELVITGEEVGLGKSVTGYKLYKDDVLLYTKEFDVVNTCVTLQDTFTFTFNLCS